MRRMRTIRSVAAAGALVLAAGVVWGAAALRGQAPTLTTRDYIDIEQLYIAYTHAIDFGAADGRDYAAVFTPDGVFALVMRLADGADGPGPCPAVGPWELADREAIRGSIPDRDGSRVCVAVLEGTERLSGMASTFHQMNGTTARHVYTNLRITPTPEGARGFVYFNQLDVSTLPPTTTVTGIYEDTLVKTADGWRFKKRVHTHDAPYG